MRFQAQMNLSHLNVRREKAGDGPGDIAADLKLSGKVCTSLTSAICS